MAGGLITTRAASESNLGEEVAGQLLAGTRPLAVAAGVLTSLALVPGLPKVAFFVVAAIMGAAAYANRKRDDAEAEDAALPTPSPDAADGVAAVEPLGIEVGYALVSLVDEKQGGTLLSRVRSIRRQIASETGLVVPSVHIADNLQLGPRTYSILLKGVEVARGELYPDRLLAINPGTAASNLEGTATREPAFGLPATWISTEQRDRASAAGYTVVDPTTALSTHLSEIIRNFLPDLLTRQQTKEMVDRVAQTSPKLVEELVPKALSLGEIQRVLRQLLRERVPVRDLTTILESVADIAAVTKDLDALTEGVRASLGRAICRQYQTDRGELPTIASRPVSKSGCLARSCGPIKVPFWRWILRKRRVSPRKSRARSKQPWHSLCFCARQRSGLTSGDCSRGCCRTSECSHTTKYRRTSGLHRSRCWSDMHLKRFRGETVRDALAGARAELGPDALVLSTQLVAGGRMARVSGCARGRSHRRHRTRSVGTPVGRGRKSDSLNPVHSRRPWPRAWRRPVSPGPSPATSSRREASKAGGARAPKLCALP